MDASVEQYASVIDAPTTLPEAPPVPVKPAAPPAPEPVRVPPPQPLPSPQREPSKTPLPDTTPLPRPLRPVCEEFCDFSETGRVTIIVEVDADINTLQFPDIERMLGGKAA